MRKITSLMIALMVSFLAFTQIKPISGKIIDEGGKPISGATIQIKGTKSAVVSDADGNFAINAKEGSLIVVSYVGFENKEIKIGNTTELAISLKVSDQSLTEVV